MGKTIPETDGTSFIFLGFFRPCMGQVTEGQERGVASNGEEPLRPSAGDGHLTGAGETGIGPSATSTTHLSAKMRGHYAYFGITGNFRRLRWYAHQVARIWQKWLSRRDRGSWFHWSRFNDLLKRLSASGSLGSSIVTPPRAKLSREEPEAGNPAHPDL